MTSGAAEILGYLVQPIAVHTSSFLSYSTPTCIFATSTTLSAATSLEPEVMVFLKAFLRVTHSLASEFFPERRYSRIFAMGCVMLHFQTSSCRRSLGKMCPARGIVVRCAAVKAYRPHLVAALFTRSFWMRTCRSNTAHILCSAGCLTASFVDD